MRAAVIQFPGSNCDRDMAVALDKVSGHNKPTQMVWHKESGLPEGLDVIAIPGGFSFGDYLRCGAIAAGLKFICKDVELSVETASSDFTSGYTKGSKITIPVAHHEGNYNADADTLKALNSEDRVAFRYADNPNGSMDDIAGILSENRRVLGMMPHPERLNDPMLGGMDGNPLFESLANSLVTA